MRFAKVSKSSHFRSFISCGAGASFIATLGTLLVACQSSDVEPDLSTAPSDAYVVSIETNPSGAECVLDGFAENLHVKSPGQLVIPQEYKDAQIVCTKEGHEDVRDDWFPGAGVEMPAIPWVRTLPKKQ
ncbi:hypothetical protein PsAD2_01706 [Pseudovibrio axinellae]|uniref:Uncharacterized protein n=1 Tax=Pseudovibrio axinellae TaxID=989403 RepID=A0A165ZGV3_9HYPH|nr:hypothetical protein [Pseudovibrio axinellae]KZL19884.1 hypothetical protein PsAD2_01706 [Pseudovibrio axinellae]SER38255.1 hypothetical protein SAMN05421798_10958 [Pseudovibrio axinellae]